MIPIPPIFDDTKGDISINQFEDTNVEISHTQESELMMNNNENFNVLRLEELNNMTKIKRLHDKELESMVTALASRANKDQVTCSLVRDTLKLVEGDNTLYAQFIDHMLQMNSICLKNYNANKGDVEEIHTIVFGDMGVTKKKLKIEGQISKIKI